MKKIIKVPAQLVNGETSQNSLVLDECTVIEQCIHHVEEQGTMYLEEHVLFFILEGSVTLTYGKQTCQIGKNEMILLKKATAVHYEKKGSPDLNAIYHGVIFSIKDVLIKSFLASVEKITPKETEEVAESGVYPMTECLITFLESLKPYFHDSSGVYPGQLRLKMMEMLYHMAIGNPAMFQQILQIYQPLRTEIRHIVEQHYASPISLKELAYLSGRSLSSFKRDFQAVYNIPPATWIREKRLEKAKEMLERTQLSVSDICFSLGFENVSHFSRIFKNYYGQAPTFYQI
ncbi:AraC-like DNA-binding protein [Pedobacter cryoconitis]|uniref:AraC-like DNA-binding protein n=1 Tax=Pedobacter cryoconitis TaxID=188932 RepID=A0A7W8ZRQ1_9SPHI|nr:helix-turn-helix domain-containing protein [Pedobacter cryoconitis]MBB5638974.1 AraC-like DNA-binding protein [Pedobacter cryoconitis]MBB6270789.1 AraC-like DNA-binding protein [Pedobacter cryoconitis]